MVRIKKKMLKGKAYYYLEHSIREGKKVQKKEKYLGRQIPFGIDKIKKEFVDEIREEVWYADIDKIRNIFSKEEKSLPKSIKEKNLQNFATQFTYDTQRIEGLTLTRRETADLLEKGITPKSKPMRDVQETEAHRNLFYDILKFKKDFTLQIMLDWHWALFNKTKPDIAGNIRKYHVGIGGSKFVPPSPLDVYPMLTEFFKWYKKNKDCLHPVELAALVHLKLVTIHPFGDGNGRITRLVMNFVLNLKKYPLFNIPYENRNSYYNALERSQIKKDDKIFLQWFVKRYTKEYKRYLK
jgi:Fic family protein